MARLDSQQAFEQHLQRDTAQRYVAQFAGCWLQFIDNRQHNALIVGEDLGTVPPAVRPMMKNHGWHRLFVGQFEVNPNQGRVLNESPEGAIASINTHDLPTFASYWLGTDIAERVEMGLLTEEESQQEQAARKIMRESVLEAIGPENKAEIAELKQEKQP